MSLADALAPTPAPAPAPAPAPTATPATAPAPQPTGAGSGNINPYIPPAAPPQNLQEAPPAQPASDQGQPAAPAQQGQPPEAAPTIPPEYLEAHDWRSKIGSEAEAFGGLDMVPQALKWSRLLFGLEQAPEGLTPAAHFMQELFQADRGIYKDLLGEIATTHRGNLIPLVEDQVLAAHGIPKDRLDEVKDFLRYGRVAADNTSHREFVGQISPEAAQIFPHLSKALQDYFVRQVDDNQMTWELAEEQIKKEGILMALQKRDEQSREQDAQREKLAEDARTQEVVDDYVGRYENAFVEAKARSMGIDPEIVRDMTARVANELDRIGTRDPNSAIARAWKTLEGAAASGNEMRINAAMGAVKIIVEQKFDEMLGRRGKAPQNGGTPPPAPPQQQNGSLRQPQQPQFEPTQPGATEDWSNVSLVDFLFDRPRT